MKLYRETLTPQMKVYDDFDDRAQTRWLPYLMYFQRADYSSPVINTDRLGFRLTAGPDGQRASLGGTVPDGPVRLFAGASSALGTGATCDEATLPSRLWLQHAPSRPWLNLGGRVHNSTQELLVYQLHRHLAPRVDEIVIYGGFNNIALAQLPGALQGETGAFFFCRDFFEKMTELNDSFRKDKRKTAAWWAQDAPVPPLEEMIDSAVTLAGRSLEVWKLLADAAGARLSYVLQPLTPWWREKPAPQEKLLFGELDKISKFGTFEKLYGAIATPEAARRYAAALRAACERAGAGFLDLNPVMPAETKPDDWIYVDRAHYTDEGHDLIARLIAEGLGLK